MGMFSNSISYVNYVWYVQIGGIVRIGIITHVLLRGIMGKRKQQEEVTVLADATGGVTIHKE